MDQLLSSFYHSFAQPAMLALARAGNRGCRIDTTLRDRLRAEAEAKRKASSAAVAAALGRPLNPDSPKQVQALLYDELKLPMQRKRQAGGLGPPTSDEEAVRKLRRLVPQHAALLTLLLDYRGHSKEASQLAVPLEVRDGESYFITSYNATGTTTGRISSSEHILGFGGNLQNQKRGPSRRIFVPRTGMVFVKADASQAEARVVAALCRDSELLERFTHDDFDIHLENAQLLYGGTVEELRKEDLAWKAAVAAGTATPGHRDSRRQRTKGVTHGANYQGGPQVAVKQADIPFAEAKAAIERYRATHPLLLVWWRRVEDTLRSCRSITTCWGRRRIFLARLDESALREAVAHEPQSTVGDLINHAFFRLDARLEAVGAWPLLQSHDEIVCECAPSRVTAVAAILREEMEQGLDIHGLRLTIPAELSVGENWYDMKGA